MVRIADSQTSADRPSASAAPARGSLQQVAASPGAEAQWSSCHSLLSSGGAHALDVSPLHLAAETLHVMNP